MLTLTELRTFIAVCRYGTFQAAGDRIGLTQSAISSQIKRLEESLGYAVFDRTGRSAVLNAAGHATLPRAEEICALCDKLPDLPGESMTMGMLRIGAIASAQSTLLAQALALLRVRFPLLRIHVVPGLSIGLVDALDAGQVDAAVIVKPSFGIPQDMKWELLLQEPYVLLAPASTPGDDWRAVLQSNPLLRYDRTSFGGRMVERFLQHQGISVRDAVEADEIGGLISLVAAGVGVALVPLTKGNLPLPKGVRTLKLEEHTFFREIGVVHRRISSMPAAKSIFVDCLRQAAGVFETAARAPKS